MNQLNSRQAECYDALGKYLPGRAFIFMNHGAYFEDLDLPELSSDDARYKYHQHLLAAALKDAPVENASVLEVGCGRGGNCITMSKYFHAKTVVGLDINPSNIEFCKRYHTIADSNLTFVLGDALNIELPAETVDILVNIESSHCYPDLGRFFFEAQRILKSGGWFCYADAFPWWDIARPSKLLRDAGFELISTRDITKNVIVSLRQNADLFTSVVQEASAPGVGSEIANSVSYGVNKDKLNQYVSGEHQYHLWQARKI